MTGRGEGTAAGQPARGLPRWRGEGGESMINEF